MYIYIYTHLLVKVKVNFTLEQPTKVERASRCIPLLLLQHRRWMGLGGQRYAPGCFTPCKDPVTIV